MLIKIKLCNAWVIKLHTAMSSYQNDTKFKYQKWKGTQDENLGNVKHRTQIFITSNTSSLSIFDIVQITLAVNKN